MARVKAVGLVLAGILAGAAVVLVVTRSGTPDPRGPDSTEVPDVVTVAVPSSITNAAGVEFARADLLESLASEGCPTTCFDGVRYCNCHHEPCNTVSYACGSCPDGETGQDTVRVRLIGGVPDDLRPDQDVLRVQVRTER